MGAVCSQGETFTESTDEIANPLVFHEQSFTFNWNHTQVKLLCFGFLRQHLAFVQLDGVARIIFNFTALADLDFICKHDTCSVNNNNRFGAPSIICNFNYNAPDVTGDISRTSRDHDLPSTVILHPFLSTLLHHVTKQPNIPNMPRIANVANTVDKIKLTMMITRMKCNHEMFEQDGYAFQLGLFRVAKSAIKTKSNCSIDDESVKSEYLRRWKNDVAYDKRAQFDKRLFESFIFDEKDIGMKLAAGQQLDIAGLHLCKIFDTYGCGLVDYFSDSDDPLVFFVDGVGTFERKYSLQVGDCVEVYVEPCSNSISCPGSGKYVMKIAKCWENDESGKHETYEFQQKFKIDFAKYDYLFGLSCRRCSCQWSTDVSDCGFECEVYLEGN